MDQSPATEKIKVLALCDYACSTGFATVASNIMRELHKTGNFDLTIQGINFTGDQTYDFERFPGRLLPAVTLETLARGGNDPYGLDKFRGLVAKGEYDVVFMLQDTFIVQMLMLPMKKTGRQSLLEIIEAKEYKPKMIHYFPIDAPPSPDWITEAVSQIDYPVPYTGYAAEETLKVDPKLKHLRRPIYHGTNAAEFNYIKDRRKVAEFRKAFFADRDGKDISAGKFVVMNLNRNQPRKDLLSTLQTIKMLKDMGVKNILFYLHMRHQDAGGNLITQAEQLGLELGEDYAFVAPNLMQNQGVDVETLNYIYNAVDCVITTTLGEGWGLSITEAFATKTPVICPNNTSMTEMGADNRAILVDSGDSYGAWRWTPDDNDRLRPVVNVEKMARAIIALRSGAKVPDIDAAYDWAHKYSWENICQEWVELFTEAAVAAKAENFKRQRPATPNRAARRKKK